MEHDVNVVSFLSLFYKTSPHAFVSGTEEDCFSLISLGSSHVRHINGTACIDTMASNHQQKDISKMWVEDTVAKLRHKITHHLSSKKCSNCAFAFDTSYLDPHSHESRIWESLSRETAARIVLGATQTTCALLQHSHMRVDTRPLSFIPMGNGWVFAKTSPSIQTQCYHMLYEGIRCQLAVFDLSEKNQPKTHARGLNEFMEDNGHSMPWFKPTSHKSLIIDGGPILTAKNSSSAFSVSHRAMRIEYVLHKTKNAVTEKPHALECPTAGRADLSLLYHMSHMDKHDHVFIAPSTTSTLLALLLNSHRRCQVQDDEVVFNNRVYVQFLLSREQYEQVQNGPIHERPTKKRKKESEPCTPIYVMVDVNCLYKDIKKTYSDHDDALEMHCLFAMLGGSPWTENLCKRVNASPHALFERLYSSEIECLISSNTVKQMEVPQDSMRASYSVPRKPKQVNVDFVEVNTEGLCILLGDQISRQEVQVWARNCMYAFYMLKNHHHIRMQLNEIDNAPYETQAETYTNAYRSSIRFDCTLADAVNDKPIWGYKRVQLPNNAIHSAINSAVQLSSTGYTHKQGSLKGPYFDLKKAVETQFSTNRTDIDKEIAAHGDLESMEQIVDTLLEEHSSVVVVSTEVSNNSFN